MDGSKRGAVVGAVGLGAALAVALVLLLRSGGVKPCGVAMTVLYTWVTPERNPADREDWFGIHSPAGTDTPDVRALTAGLRAATASGPAVDVCAG